MIGSKKQNILLLTVICCATLALISITWAAFSSTLKLSGQASVTAQSWDIDFTNTVGTKWTTAQTLTGTKTNLAELPTSSSGAFGLPLDQTASGFLGSLRMSGDKITYTWYVQNFGTFEAKYSISGLISTSKYLSGSNVDIDCNTSDNSTNKTFCNNYVKTTLTIDGVVADAGSSYTLAKAGQTGDSSTLVLTIEIIGDNQIYTATAGAFENRYSNTNPSMLLGGIEMLDSSSDLNINVKGLSLSGTQSVAEVASTNKVTTTKAANAVSTNVSLGEYVSYTPTETSYTFLSINTGYSSNISINPSELNLWRVLKINDDDTVDLISLNVTSETIIFQGKTGYLNFVDELEKAAQSYIDSTYISSARMLGYDDNQIRILTNTTMIDQSSVPWTSSTTDNSNESLGGGDVYYLNDLELLSEANIPLDAENVYSTLSQACWIVSRYYAYNTSSWTFGARYSYNNGIGTNFPFVYKYTNGSSNQTSVGASARPIVTVKSSVKVSSGTGTKSDPYILTA